MLGCFCSTLVDLDYICHEKRPCFLFPFDLIKLPFCGKLYPQKHIQTTYRSLYILYIYLPAVTESGRLLQLPISIIISGRSIHFWKTYPIMSEVFRFRNFMFSPDCSTLIFAAYPGKKEYCNEICIDFLVYE